MEDVKKRMDELVELLNDANYHYYTLSDPKITDQEFDKYLRELEDLESAYPDLVRDDSPTKRVGGEVLTGFQKVTHTYRCFLFRTYLTKVRYLLSMSACIRKLEIQLMFVN